MEGGSAEVEQVLHAETARPAAPDVMQLVAAVRARFGAAVRGVLFYGSCRRGVPAREGIVDFWVVVDARRNCERPWAARLGRWLPPNVYFLETPGPDGTPLRAKLALFTMAELERGATALETYVWGRLAQPVSIVFAATDEDERALLSVLARSACTFLDDALQVGQGSTVLEVWRDGLGRSYGSELRAEGGGRATDVIGSDAAHYEALTRALRAAAFTRDANGVERVMVGSAVRADVHARRWRGRVRAGKLRSLLRLLKGLYTFEGGLDYIAWKLSRHSGREIVIPARVRRWPLVFVWGFAWTLYRQGVFR